MRRAGVSLAVFVAGLATWLANDGHPIDLRSLGTGAFHGLMLVLAYNVDPRSKNEQQRQERDDIRAGTD